MKAKYTLEISRNADGEIGINGIGADFSDAEVIGYLEIAKQAIIANRINKLNGITNQTPTTTAHK